MPTTTAGQLVRTINIRREAEIAAPVEIASDAVPAECSPEGEMPGGKSFPMKVELWPGGRRCQGRCRGRGLDNGNGHLRGHMQVIIAAARRAAGRKPLI